MSAFVSTRAPLDLGAVNEAVGYARSVCPSMPVPDLGGDRFWWQVNMHLHGVALDALYAALAFNDDLSWGAVRDRRDEQRGYAYSAVTVELRHASLTLYSEHSALHAAAATTNAPAG